VAKLDDDGRIANSSATRSQRLAPSEAVSVGRKGNSYDHTIRADNAPAVRPPPRSGAATCLVLAPTSIFVSLDPFDLSWQLVETRLTRKSEAGLPAAHPFVNY
jgi:hypothetical protein